MKKVIFSLTLLALITSAVSASCIKGNCYNGKGVYLSEKGNKYIGTWKRGQRSGEGRLYFASGDYYIGQFAANTFSGKGKFEYQSGDIYKGEWQKGLSHGHGEYRFTNGDRYVGTFVRGQIEGRGTYYYHNGQRYEGSWKNNMKHGHGTLYLEDGSSRSGEWSRDRLTQQKMVVSSTTLRDCSDNRCMSGEGVYHYADGSRWEGPFSQGSPAGEGVCYYANGDVYRGGWKNHSPHGRGVMTFANGNTYGAIWKLGLPQKQVYDDFSELYADASSPTATSDAGETKIYAMIVGVANYDHLPSLKYTDDDAYHLYAFLKSPEGGALPDEQIHLLVDEAASQQRIIQNVNEILAKADENDVVIFYMSGHGFEGAFAPQDFDGYNNRLGYDQLMEAFEGGRAKHKLFVADACHSGSLTASKRGIGSALANFYDRFAQSTGGAAIMTSSKGSEVSLEYSGLRQGVFSHFFIRGLKGEADRNADHIVNIGELFDFVYSGVREYTSQGQTPSMIGNYDRNMPIAWLR